MHILAQERVFLGNNKLAFQQCHTQLQVPDLKNIELTFAIVSWPM
jgi:hypothetical protein